MLDCRRQHFFLLVAGAILLASACRKSGENSGAATQGANTPTTIAPAAPQQRHHGMFMSGVSPLIVSMSPETITVHEGHAPMSRYALTYEIDHSEKVTKAYISIYVRGIGEVQRFAVDVQPRGSIEFLLDASNVDLGATVRFRAHCPGNDTDWFVMGSDPSEYPQNLSSRQIGDVSPNYVQVGRTPRAGGLPVEIWGSQITSACTAEAQVDGASVELQNAVAGDKKIRGLLSYSDLQGRPVVQRRLEVNLVVQGPGMPAEDTYYLKFVDN